MWRRWCIRTALTKWRGPTLRPKDNTSVTEFNAIGIIFDELNEHCFEEPARGLIIIKTATFSRCTCGWQNNKQCNRRDYTGKTLPSSSECWGEIFLPTKVVAYQFQEIHYDASAGHSHFVYPCYFSFIGTSFLWLQVSQFPWTVQGWPHRLLMSLSSFLSCASSRELKGNSSLRELGVEDKGSCFPVAGSCMTA